MDEYLIFEQDFLEIPFDDMAGARFIICLDPQKRLGPKTWAVVEVNSMGEYVESKGLFWVKELAVIFTEVLI